MESYSYLGLGTIVNMGHSQTGVDLTYIDPLGLPGDGGDKYAGLDRFGRVIDHRWYKASTATDVDRFGHTYDRNSNRLTRDVTATGAPATLDEAYTYDNLNRLTKVNQGTLVANSITDALATYSKSWNLDALGNWKTMVEDLDGGGSGTATTQSRTANARNQISSITGLTTPTYDAKGNMTAEETGQKLIYDGWDRLTKVQDSASQNKVSYTYDGLGRRIKRTDHGANLTSTADDVTTNIYYGGEADWQMLEERVGSTVKNQYVWSPRYIDAMVLRDRDATTGGDLGKTGSGLDERLYPTHDSNFNVTSILDIAGAVVERFRSDPYGDRLTIMNAAWQTVTEMKEWQHFFQGGRRDGISDLYHFRNREYDPVLAVWTRMDPLGDVDGMNLYQYLRSAPIHHTDPTGLAAPAIGLAAIALIALKSAAAAAGLTMFGCMMTPSCREAAAAGTEKLIEEAIDACTPRTPPAPPVAVPAERTPVRSRNPKKCCYYSCDDGSTTVSEISAGSPCAPMLATGETLCRLVGELFGPCPRRN